MRRILLATTALLISFEAHASVIVFECSFQNAEGSLFVTIYDDGSPARIGSSQGVGDRGQAHYDSLTKSWGIVEFNGGNMPVTLTSINARGEAIHSRQYNDVSGAFVAPSQSAGSCSKKEIR